MHVVINMRYNEYKCFLFIVPTTLRGKNTEMCLTSILPNIKKTFIEL